MQFMMNLVVVLQLLSAIVIIGLVLLQQGKGADMGASFGAGASGTLFGATGSANVLSKSTAIAATLFFVCTLVLAYFGNLRGSAPAGDSLLDTGVAASAPAASATLSGAAAVPGAEAVAPAASIAASQP